MYYRKYGNYIYGEMDDYELEDNLTGSFIAHPNSKHGNVVATGSEYTFYVEATKSVPELTYNTHKHHRIFWRTDYEFLMPEAPHWAYKFVDVYRHSGIAYSETTRTNSLPEPRRGWDWSTCELLWILDYSKQQELQREVDRLKKENPKRKKADILEELVDETFKRDLMWLDLANNGECLTDDEFLENMGQTFEEWYEEVHGEPYTE